MRLMRTILAAPMVLAPVTAGAATLEVSTAYAAVDGACALVEAIDNANANAQIHADCPAGSGADTIVLTSDLLLDGSQIFPANGPNGLPSITSPVTLDGGGHSLVRDAAAPAFRLLHVGVGGDLTVHRLELANGLMEDGFDNGGAVYNAGTLTLSESVLRDSRVASIFPSGGGIYNLGNLTIVNSTLRGNEAVDDTFSSGGAVYSNAGSTLYAVNARFHQNLANQAGAVFAFGDATVVENSQFLENEARETAGALLLFNNLNTNSHQVLNSLFQDNRAAEDGGAILSGSADALLFGNAFIGNRITEAGVGGAVLNLLGEMTITASRFEHNRAEANAVGGALGNLQLGTVHLEGSVLQGNESDTFGGGFYTQLAEVFISDSLITGNSAETGGGLFQDASNVDGFHVQRSALVGNSASFGGGAIAAVGNLSVARLVNTTLADNEAPTLGGGIFLNQGGRVNISHTAVVDNISTDFSNSVGGFSAFAGTTEIASSILAYNLALDCSATNQSASLGYNITTGSAGGVPPDRWCSFIPLQTTDLTDTDPLLAPLADNGNLGPSRLLDNGSPAAAAIPGGCPAELMGVDQRGVPRPPGACDVGPVSRTAARLPVIAFAEAASAIVDEGSAPAPHVVELLVDNTSGNLAAPAPDVPLSLNVKITGNASPLPDYDTSLPVPTILVVDGSNWPAPGSSLSFPLDFTVIDDTLVESDETIELSVSLTGPGLLGAQTTHTVTILDDDGLVRCEGFYSPLHRDRTIPARSQGVIPVKLELLDAQGQALTDADVVAPPRLRVADSQGETYGAQPREDQDLLPVGNSNTANIFAFNPADRLWEFRLDTSQFPLAGTYEVSVYSGDSNEYRIEQDGGCQQAFIRLAEAHRNGRGRK